MHFRFPDMDKIIFHNMSIDNIFINIHSQIIYYYVFMPLSSFNVTGKVWFYFPRLSFHLIKILSTKYIGTSKKGNVGHSAVVLRNYHPI